LQLLLLSSNIPSFLGVMMLDVKIKRLKEDAKIPFRQTDGSSGYDLYSNEAIKIKPLETFLVSTGISIEIPLGYEAQVRPRSGLAIKKAVTVLNTPGTIDSDYRGEVKVILINLGKEEVSFSKHERIAQLVFQKIESINFILDDDLSKTDRGDGGFGSSGLN
jgi:dUTP pyrophosphatase